MKLPSTLLHHHHALPRRIPAVSFPLSLPTPVKRQSLSPRLLQFRSSSSSGSDDVDFRTNLHRLIAAQRSLDRAQSKGGFTIREVIQRARTEPTEERRAMMDQYFNAETERWTTMRYMIQEEITRVDLSDIDQMRRLMGRNKTTKIAQLILERAAEPRHSLTPDDLKMVEKAVLHIAKTSEKGTTHMKVVGLTLGASLLYYVYTIMDWSP